jgi:TPP-dependent pyruvate/acetoin dehydrogenase alpha subunit
MAVLHFTSGTTDMLKGAIHVHNAGLTHYITGKYALDFHPGDVFWCTADPGWVTGTSYGVIASLVHGVTNIVDFEAKTRVYGGNAIVDRLALVVGLALADKMQIKRHVTCCFFGDGAVAEGEFHQSMNPAALWQLPVLFVCENYLHAMRTALKLSQSITGLAQKAASDALPAVTVDGMDVLAVEAGGHEGAAHVRAGRGPFRAGPMYKPFRTT